MNSASANSGSSDAPRVTVVLPVYNGAQYLRPAIESILCQSFADFEFIIINDGSTDQSEAIIKGYRDPRIRLINQQNLGIVSSRNRGVACARSPYLAWMDADDISAPTRLEKEVKVLDSCPNIVVVGTSIIRLNAAGEELRTEYYAAHDPELRQGLPVRSPFASGSTMIRTDMIRTVGGYRGEFPVAEDYDLWRRLATVGEFRNIIEPLYFYRENPGGLTARNWNHMTDIAMRISREILEDPNYPVDISLRRRLASYGDMPPDPKMAITARIIEDYWHVSLACVRRGKIVLGGYRLAKLFMSHRKARRLIANKIAGVIVKDNPFFEL